MRRSIQPLSLSSPKLASLLSACRGVSGFQWMRAGQKQKRQLGHDSCFRLPTHQQWASTTRGLCRWESRRNSPIAMHLTGNIGSFHTDTVTPSDEHNNTLFRPPNASGGGRDVCQLFREVGDRIESADRDRKPNAHPPSGIAPDTTQRKSAASLASEFCESYLSIPDKQPTSSSSSNDPKQEFMELLLHKQYDVKEESILSVIDTIRSHPLRDADVLRIRELCTPQYESIFHYILGSAQQDLGVAFLVKLRRDIRDIIHYWKFVQKREETDDMGGKPQSKDGINSHQLAKLQSLERNIQTILTSLFRPGVLDLQRITYQDTPASIIEQIAFKEAVHPLRSLQDLRTRLGPGRRCFAFFHPALPNKPLVFVHVALSKEMPNSMNDLQHASESDATCATFYSITNTERGLAGVDLGNHLIKSVVSVLQNDFPKLDKFCTLSPVPKFRKWLEDKILRYHEGLLRQHQSKQDDCEENSSDSSVKFMDDGLFRTEELEQLQDIFSSDSPLLDLLDTLKSPTWHMNSSDKGSMDLNNIVR